MPRPPVESFSPPQRGGMRRQILIALLAALLSGLASASAQAITIRFDYSFDTTGFFGTAANPTPARTTLEFAARAFTPFADTLAPILPGGQNAWKALFQDPSASGYREVTNLEVPANTLIVYAMARDLAGAAIGQSSPGIHSFIGTPTVAFSNAVASRNQGDSRVDFAPWGGAIAFDVRNSNNEDRKWHYDLASPPPSDSYDFYTTATHELAHILGFGASTAFAADVVNKQFVGVVTQTLYGGPVPMYAADPESQHWDFGVTSPPFLQGTRPRPLLGPLLGPGERKSMTPLDYAALTDIGWQAPAKLLQLPADLNGDRVVDGGDFLLWQRSFGKSGGAGDANGDGLSDGYDGWLIRQYFGSIGQGAVLSRGAAIPEPAAGLIGLASLLGLVSLRRRRAIRFRHSR